jgi:tetraacyldisaccharide 4'-kinase
MLPLSGIYAYCQKLRALLYKIGIFRTNKLPRPVISVGNITVGGTGKTPVTAYIARFLLEQNFRVAILSRGYGGSLEGETFVVSDGHSVMLSAAECGDEPYLLASTIPGLMVVIGTDRYATGMLAMKQLSPDIFIMDDGFQHLRLHRDLNILLLDYVLPFGNGLTLPAGLLREPEAAALRADIIIHTRCPEGVKLQYQLLGKPNIIAHHFLQNLEPFLGGSSILLHELTGKRILAFAAIAEPLSFFEGLQNHGLQLVHKIAFSDHSPYTVEKQHEILAAVRSESIDYLITTAKDAVKLEGIPDELARRIYVANLELVIDDADVLNKRVINLLQK